MLEINFPHKKWRWWP